MSHTYAVLEVSPEAFAEIKAKLLAAHYDHALSVDGDGVETIDMHGIGLQVEPIIVIAADGRTNG